MSWMESFTFMFLNSQRNLLKWIKTAKVTKKERKWQRSLKRQQNGCCGAIFKSNSERVCLCVCVFVAVAHFKWSLLNFVITNAESKQSQLCVKQSKGGNKQERDAEMERERDGETERIEQANESNDLANWNASVVSCSCLQLQAIIHF